MTDYSSHDCGGPTVCSGCSSWRHGVNADGSGDPQALEARKRSRPTEEQRCRTAGIDPESVECPTCGAWVDWACNETHAGRYGGSHVAPVHPARARQAREAKTEMSPEEEWRRHGTHD